MLTTGQRLRVEVVDAATIIRAAQTDAAWIVSSWACTPYDTLACASPGYEWHASRWVRLLVSKSVFASYSS